MYFCAKPPECFALKSNPKNYTLSRSVVVLATTEPVDVISDVERGYEESDAHSVNRVGRHCLVAGKGCRTAGRPARRRNLRRSGCDGKDPARVQAGLRSECQH